MATLTWAHVILEGRSTILSTTLGGHCLVFIVCYRMPYESCCLLSLDVSSWLVEGRSCGCWVLTSHDGSSSGWGKGDLDEESEGRLVLSALLDAKGSSAAISGRDSA